MLFSSSFLILHFTPIAIGGHSMFFIGHFTRFQDYMITGFSSILPIFHFSILPFFNFYRISRLQDFLPFFQFSTFPFFHSSIFTGFQDFIVQNAESIEQSAKTAAYWLLPAANCLLPTANCQLLTANFSSFYLSTNVSNSVNENLNCRDISCSFTTGVIASIWLIIILMI